MIAEWPLIAFTAASQLACGLALAAAFLDLRSGSPGAEEGRVVGMLIFPVAVLGLAGSLFHLGRPLAAWRALLNWRSSPLSVEVLFYGFFLAAALVASGLWALRRKDGRLVAGAAAAVLGLGAVVSSSLIYLLPGRSPWNGPWVPVSFLGSALVLGGTAGAAFGDTGRERPPQKAFLLAAAAGGLTVIGSAVLMAVRFSGPPADPYTGAQLETAGRMMASEHALGLLAFIILSGLLPAALAVLKWRASRPFPLAARTVFWAALAGVIAGRAWMFAVGTRIPLF